MIGVFEWSLIFPSRVILLSFTWAPNHFTSAYFPQTRQGHLPSVISSQTTWDSPPQHPVGGGSSRPYRNLTAQHSIVYSTICIYIYCVYFVHTVARYFSIISVDWLNMWIFVAIDNDFLCVLIIQFVCVWLSMCVIFFTCFVLSYAEQFVAPAWLLDWRYWV